MHICMPITYTEVLFSYYLMYPTLPLMHILFTSHRNIRSEHYTSLNNKQRAIEQAQLLNEIEFQHSASRELIQIERELIG